MAGGSVQARFHQLATLRGDLVPLTGPFNHSGEADGLQLGLLAAGQPTEAEAAAHAGNPVEPHAAIARLPQLLGCLARQQRGQRRKGPAALVEAPGCAAANDGV